MKKIAALLSMIVWMDIAVAQSTTTTSGFASYFTAGPRVGLNMSNISGATGAEGKTGLLAGAFLVYSFQEHFGASIDALYSMEGAEYTETDITTGGVVMHSEVKDRLNYLRIPVQANVFLGEFGQAFRPKVSLGPVIGFLLNAERKAETSVEDGPVTTLASSSRDVKDSYTSTDFGAIAGAGFNLRIMEMTWFNFDARYYLGATDIRTVKPAGTNERKNNVFSLSAGVGFGF